MKFDVKVTRALTSAIVAGPFDTEAEAQMYALKYSLDFDKWKADKLKALEEIEDELDRAVEKRNLDKTLADNDTVFVVIPHKRGGI